MAGLQHSLTVTSNKVQSFIGVIHICRTRYMHQLSVAALYMLMIIVLKKKQLMMMTSILCHLTYVLSSLVLYKPRWIALSFQERQIF